MSQQFRSPKGAALSQPRPSGLGNVDHETQGLKAQYKMPVAYKIEWDSNASLQGICARRASWSLRCEAGVPSEALIQGLQPSLADATMLPRPSGLGWDRAAPLALGACLFHRGCGGRATGLSTPLRYGRDDNPIFTPEMH